MLNYQKFDVLMQCKCSNDDLTRQKLHGKPYGGEFECLICGNRTPAKVVNRKNKNKI